GLGTLRVPDSLKKIASAAAANPVATPMIAPTDVKRFHQIERIMTGNKLAPVIDSAQSTSCRGSVGAMIVSKAPQTATMITKPRMIHTRLWAGAGSQDSPCTTSSHSTAASDTVVALAVTRAAASVPAMSTYANAIGNPVATGSAKSTPSRSNFSPSNPNRAADGSNATRWAVAASKSHFGNG